MASPTLAKRWGWARNFMYLPLIAQLLFLILAVSINVLLVFLVRQARPKTDLSRFFSLFCASASLWAATVFFSVLFHTPSGALFFARLSIFFSIWHAASLFFLVNIFPDEKLYFSKRQLAGLLSVTAAMAILTLTPFVFQSVEVAGKIVRTQAGFGIIFFGVFIHSLAISSIYLLIKKLRRESGERRALLSAVLCGALLMFVLIIATIFLPIAAGGNVVGVQFASFYILLFIAPVAYSIIRHKLFGIKLMTVQILTALFLLITVAELFLAQLFNKTHWLLFFILATFVLGAILLKYINREIALKERVTNLAGALQSANAVLEELGRQRGELLSLASERLSVQQNGPDQQSPDGSRLAYLIQSFDDLSKWEKGEAVLNLEPTDMNGFVEASIKENDNLFKNRGLTVVLQKSNTAASQSRLTAKKLKPFWQDCLTMPCDTVRRVQQSGYMCGLTWTMVA